MNINKSYKYFCARVIVWSMKLHKSGNLDKQLLYDVLFIQVLILLFILGNK